MVVRGGHPDRGALHDPAVPAAIAIAVLRHQLLDIRLVLARALAWLLLSAAALVAYVALVALLDLRVARLRPLGLRPGVVAVLLAPLLPRLQREVERWMYGDRRDPARVAGRLGEHLAAGDERGLQGWSPPCGGAAASLGGGPGRRTVWPPRTGRPEEALAPAAATPGRR